MTNSRLRPLMSACLFLAFFSVLGCDSGGVRENTTPEATPADIAAEQAKAEAGAAADAAAAEENATAAAKGQ